MTLTEAIEILKLHNQWRRGAEIEPQNPTEIGQAIDLVIEAASDKLLLDGVDCTNERVHNADLE